MTFYETLQKLSNVTSLEEGMFYFKQDYGWDEPWHLIELPHINQRLTSVLVPSHRQVH